MKTYGLIFTNDNPAAAPAVSLAPTLTTFMTLGGTTLTPPGITKPISTLGLYTFEWSPTLPIYFLADGGTLVTDTTQRYLSGILDPVDAVNEQAATLTAYGMTNFALGTTSVALGTTNVALATSCVALGTTAVAIGTTNLGYGLSNIALGTTNVALNITLTGYAASIYAQALTLADIQGGTLSQAIYAAIGTTASVIGDDTTDPGTLYGLLKRLQEFNEGNQTFNKTTGAWAIASRGATTLANKTLSNNNTQVTKS